jgi:hypothetical protein
MGGNTEVDVNALRAVAEHVTEAANGIAEMQWHTLPAEELRGSAVGNVEVPDLILAKLADVIANMRGWAMAARMAADAFERADRGSAQRFPRR